MARMWQIGKTFEVGQRVQVNGLLASGPATIKEIRLLDPMSAETPKNAEEPFPHVIVSVDGRRKPIRYNAIDLMDGKVQPLNGATPTTAPAVVAASPSPYQPGMTVYVDGDLFEGLGVIEKVLNEDKHADEPYPHVYVRSSHGKLYRFHADELDEKLTTDPDAFPTVEDTLDMLGFDFDIIDSVGEAYLHQRIKSVVDNDDFTTIGVDGHTITIQKAVVTIV